MTPTPLTIREKALSDMKYFLDESDAILKKVPTTLKNNILLAKISFVAAAIFAVFGVGNAIGTIMKRSCFPLRYSGMCGLGIVSIGIFLHFLGRSHKQTKNIYPSLKPLSASLRQLSEYWESNTKKGLNDFEKLDSSISPMLGYIHSLGARNKKELISTYPWISHLADHDKTFKSFRNILVIQDLFRILVKPDKREVSRLLKCYKHSTFSVDAKKKIQEIADFVQKNPSFIYQKELTLATLDNFDSEAMLRTV